MKPWSGAKPDNCFHAPRRCVQPKASYPRERTHLAPGQPAHARGQPTRTANHRRDAVPRQADAGVRGDGVPEDVGGANPREGRDGRRLLRRVGRPRRDGRSRRACSASRTRGSHVSRSKVGSAYQVESLRPYREGDDGEENDSSPSSSQARPDLVPTLTSTPVLDKDEADPVPPPRPKLVRAGV